MCVTKAARDVGFYIMVAIIGLILATVAAAAVIDLIYRRRYNEGNHTALNGTDHSLEVPQIIEQTKTVSAFNGNGTTVTTHHFESQRAIMKSKYGYANVPMFLKPSKQPSLQTVYNNSKINNNLFQFCAGTS